jgi:uncharacterized membrane protein
LLSARFSCLVNSLPTRLPPLERLKHPLKNISETVLGIMQPIGNPEEFGTGFQIATREFVGNQQMGYKTALCERDVAIYGAIFIAGLLYSRVRYRLRPVPIWLYVLLGIAPIGIDGLSQLLGNAPFNLWPPRETLPVFRVLTGALFGLMNVWLAFPHLERSMYETRQQILGKFARAGINPSTYKP